MARENKKGRNPFQIFENENEKTEHYKMNKEIRRVEEYLYRLIEWELKKLLKEMSGDENFRHFYKIDQSYPNAHHIKDIQINLERHNNEMARFFGDSLR